MCGGLGNRGEEIMAGERQSYLWTPGDASLWGREVAVSGRSQMVYPNGSEAWCSPISLSKVTAYLWTGPAGETLTSWSRPWCGARATKRTGGPGTGHSIWRALLSWARRFESLRQVERFVVAGVISVVASIPWKEGELSEASIPQKTCWSTIRSAEDSRVRRVCSREEFVWASGSGGIAPALR